MTERRKEGTSDISQFVLCKSFHLPSPRTPTSLVGTTSNSSNSLATRIISKHLSILSGLHLRLPVRIDAAQKLRQLRFHSHPEYGRSDICFCILYFLSYLFILHFFFFLSYNFFFVCPSLFYCLFPVIFNFFIFFFLVSANLGIFFFFKCFSPLFLFNLLPSFFLLSLDFHSLYLNR